MNFAMIINVYIDVDETSSNPFDHPTELSGFEEKNTLRATVESINMLERDETDSLRIYIMGIATQQSIDFDESIRSYIKDCFADCPYESLIFTNSDILLLKEKTRSKFISVNGYPEVRNMGFILPSIMDEDIIIQIDDDELLRPLYISRLKEVLSAHPDKYLFTAPYEKDGTVRIHTEDPLKNWHKFSSMDKDMQRYYVESNDIQESLFGFGGNMIIRREFAEQIPYPLGVPRGEDFSMLLASRLVYENGNPYAGIERMNMIFRSFFVPFVDMTIIHRPPSEAKEDFLQYFENNMKRFIMEWGIFRKQRGLTIERLETLSHYIRQMIGYEDFKGYLAPIFDELYERYPVERIDQIKHELYRLISYYREFDRWTAYQKDQKAYIELIKRLETEPSRELILGLGRA